MSDDYPGSERHFTPSTPAKADGAKLPVPAMLGYANVYRDEDGEIELGATDLCDEIDSPFRGIAQDHIEYLGRAKVVLISDY